MGSEGVLPWICLTGSTWSSLCLFGRPQQVLRIWLCLGPNPRLRPGLAGVTGCYSYPSANAKEGGMLTEQGLMRCEFKMPPERQN